MIYAWSILEKGSSFIVLAVGVISAKTSKEAEDIVRKDWNIPEGYFQYSTVKEDPISKQSILLYKKKGEENG